jgi:glycogen debranching enzyme
VTTLNGSIPHALLYDLTHDNETPLDKRTAEDALATGALTVFSYCAVGSVKGFDDLYPKLLNLVSEKRQYEISGLGPGSGISPVKRLLNSLHFEMVLGGFDEGHVHQENDVSLFLTPLVMPLNMCQVYYLASSPTSHAEGVFTDRSHRL